MKTQRFFGTTTREALARVKAALGEDAIILRNRKLDNGIEILAVAESQWSEQRAAFAAASVGPGDSPKTASPIGRAGLESLAERNFAPTPKAEISAERSSFVVAQGRPRPPAMSTVSFERYALQRQQTAPSARAPLRSAVTEPVARAPEAVQTAGPEPVLRLDGHGAAATAAANQRLVDEMRQMRSFISQQFSALSWVDGVRRTPGQATLLRRLIDAGFSARLSRILVSRLPADYGDDEALVWMHSALARNLRCDDWQAGLLANGGVFALVGPTGVGKTTTTAKIAAHFALRHGVESVGLITIDSYRIAAQDQLRAFGELIGVPVLSAHDGDTLAAHLRTLTGRRLVLIDTAGVSQRDARVPETIDMLGGLGVQRLLVLNAAAQEGTLEEVIDAYRGRECAGVVLSKTDESPRLGGAIDTLIRHRLRIAGVADGQRVPEDWHEPDAASLVATALEPRIHEEFLLDDIELTMLMQRIDGAAAPLAEPKVGAMHA